MNASKYILPACVLIAASVASAQQGKPTVGYVYPAGAAQGATVKVTAGGQFLVGARKATICGTGVTATVVEYIRPLNQQQINDLRTEVRELQQQKRQAAMRRPATSRPAAASQPSTQAAWTAKDEKLLADGIDKLGRFGRARAIPALGEQVILEIAVAADAAPGRREIRIETANGLSNPIVFCIGDLAEVSEKAAIGLDAFGISGEDNMGLRWLQQLRPDEPVRIEMPCLVNGQIVSGDVDRYRFAARKGQKIVMSVQARQLVPYMADAVPGWFQAFITVYDAAGKELASAGHYRFDPDPALCFEVPRDGEYIVAIRDAIYRGREDFVYRLSIGELPFVTSVFPLGAAAGQQATVELAGWNLPGKPVDFDARKLSVGPCQLTAGAKLRCINPVGFEISDLPEVLEKGPNNDLANAQSLSLPVIVNGRIERAGQWDVFSFKAKAGQQIVAEITARRLGSPLDSAIKITDSSGKQLAFNDDFEDKAAGLLTHHADSRVTATMPADGAYYVHVCDIQRKAGSDYAYRLRLAEPRPGFELRVAPSSINVRSGSSAQVTVTAIRKDGFDGPIALSLEGAPAGVSLKGGTIPAGKNEVKLTISAPQFGPRWRGEVATIRLQGKANVDGRSIAKDALPAEDMMQAFAWRHLVPAAELKLCILNRPPQPARRPGEAASRPGPTPSSQPATKPATD